MCIFGSDFTARAWVAAIQEGWTVMSSGPLVEFKVNGKLPGEAISFSGEGPHEVRLEGTVWSVTPLRKIVIYHNGSVWKELHPGGDRFSIPFSERAGVSASGWFSLVAEADDFPPAAPEVYSQAVTNCVRVYVGNGKIRNAESAAYFLKWIEKLRAMTRKPDLWRSPAEQQHVFAQFQRASAIYEERRREAKP